MNNMELIYFLFLFFNDTYKSQKVNLINFAIRFGPYSGENSCRLKTDRFKMSET
jgi:hypothetical protein